MGNVVKQTHLYSQLNIFSARTPLLSLANGALLVVFFVLIVIGTYGTFKGGIEKTNQSYLHIAFPAAVALLTILLVRTGLNRSKVTLYALCTHEGFLLICFYALAFIELFSAPQKLLGTIAVATGTFVTVLLVTNHVTTKQRHAITFRFLCALIYVTALIALLSGAYTYWVGSFTVGPLLIEYNKLFWRVNSWFISSTAFGVFLAYGIITTIYFTTTSHHWVVRSIHLLVIAGFIMGMGLSGSRTAFLVLIVSLLVLAATRLSFRKHYIAVLSLSITLLVFAVWLISPYSQEILILRRFLGEDAKMLGGRFDMWQDALGSWDKQGIFQVVFGSGLGTFRETLGWDIGAHSGVLRILIEHGILGLITFLALMNLTLWRIMLVVRHTPRPTPEMIILLLFMAQFFSAEIVIQQLMGISMDYLLFLTLLGLHLSARRLHIS